MRVLVFVSHLILWPLVIVGLYCFSILGGILYPWWFHFVLWFFWLFHFSFIGMISREQQAASNQAVMMKMNEAVNKAKAGSGNG